MTMPEPDSTWRELLESEAKDHDDDLTNLVVYPETVLWPCDYLHDIPQEGATEKSTLDIPFYAGFGLPNGPHFTAWTANRVYFPMGYDGAEWVGSAPRNPCEEATGHIGGGY